MKRFVIGSLFIVAALIACGADQSSSVAQGGANVDDVPGPCPSKLKCPSTSNDDNSDNGDNGDGNNIDPSDPSQCTNMSLGDTDKSACDTNSLKCLWKDKTGHQTTFCFTCRSYIPLDSRPPGTATSPTDPVCTNGDTPTITNPTDNGGKDSTPICADNFCGAGSLSCVNFGWTDATKFTCPVGDNYCFDKGTNANVCQSSSGAVDYPLPTTASIRTCDIGLCVGPTNNGSCGGVDENDYSFTAGIGDCPSGSTICQYTAADGSGVTNVDTNSSLTPGADWKYACTSSGSGSAVPVNKTPSLAALAAKCGQTFSGCPISIGDDNISVSLDPCATCQGGAILCPNADGLHRYSQQTFLCFQPNGPSAGSTTTPGGATISPSPNH